MKRAWSSIAALVACFLTEAGCSALSSPESQLFSKPGRYDSAAITYRLRANNLGGKASTQLAEGTKDAAARDRVSPVTYDEPAPAPSSQRGRVTVLAIRYPHPAGRAGYARVEVIVVGDPSRRARFSKLPGWLDRVRRMANDTLPGVSMSDGVDEAMGLDLRMAELDRLLARLEQPSGAPSAMNTASEASLKGTLNGKPVPTLRRHVAELDSLIARVRCQGTVISYKALVSELDLDDEAADEVSPSGAVQAGYLEGAPVRLPAVTPAICHAESSASATCESGVVAP